MTTCYWKHFGAGAVVHEPCVVLNPQVIEIFAGARVDAFTKLAGGQGITIGENVHVSSFCHINAGSGSVRVLSHAGLASHVVICGGATDYSQLAITPQDGGKAKRLVTIIGEYALVFAGAIVLPGVTVGRGAVIAAGAVVTRDVPPFAIVKGNPAVIVGERKVTA